ncbi:hypothetical protein ATCC90586_005478 [Pythium insidiosum]|nr:hypothetical protein ATCC90586_005478 [Pythium insidiosum]
MHDDESDDEDESEDDEEDGDEDGDEDDDQENRRDGGYDIPEAIDDVLQDMAAAAAGKTAVPNNSLLRSVIILPSLRRRAALLSGLAAKGAVLPVPVVQVVLEMAGRCAMRKDRNEPNMVRADTYSDVLALAGAWRTSACKELTNRTPDWLLHERPSCGRGRVCLCLKSLEQVAPCTQRLAELVRLIAIAARAGPDIFRLLWTLPSPCPYLQCAWCDDADDEVNVTLKVLNGRVKEPKILKDALFDWDEATASTEFTALRDALLSAAAQQQQRRAREISVTLHVTISSLVKVCGGYGAASLEHVTDMTVALDQAALEDASIMSKFYDEVNVTLTVYNGRVKEPKILKDALFDWDEATASTEFTALRDALLSAAAQHQQRRPREISVTLDPHRRLAQTLQTLYIYTTQQAYPTVKEAVDCMLLCNSQLVGIEIEESQYSDEEDDSDDDDDISAASDEDSDDSREGDGGFSSSDDEDDVTTRQDTANPATGLLQEMAAAAAAAAAAGKTAISWNQLLPDVIILPSIRRRTALLSVLAARGIDLPAPIVKDVFQMAGRCALRLSRCRKF